MKHTIAMLPSYDSLLLIPRCVAAFMIKLNCTVMALRHNIIYPTWALYHSNWVGFNYHKLQP